MLNPQTDHPGEAEGVRFRKEGRLQQFGFCPNARRCTGTSMVSDLEVVSSNSFRIGGDGVRGLISRKECI